MLPASVEHRLKKSVIKEVIKESHTHADLSEVLHVRAVDVGEVDQVEVGRLSRLYNTNHIKHLTWSLKGRA